MSSADLVTVVITCPHCGTRYQVPPATIGADGRDVQCAHCGRDWHAKAEAPPPPPPPPKPALAAVPPARPASEDRLFSDSDEAKLDEAFESVAAEIGADEVAPRPTAADPPEARSAATGPANSIDAATHRKAVSSFQRRQQTLLKGLPLARIRRLARLGAVAAVVLLFVIGIGFRADFVRAYPSLAGLYGAVGLPVNVVGLTFEDTKTLSSLRGGQTVMQISAKIRSVASQTIRVPSVVVSLLGAKSDVLYEWTVAPDVVEMEPGEVQDFSTEVNSPPEGAVRVRLGFTTKG